MGSYPTGLGTPVSEIVYPATTSGVRSTASTNVSAGPVRVGYYRNVNSSHPDRLLKGKASGEGLDFNLAFNVLPNNENASLRFGGGLFGYRGNDDGISSTFTNPGSHKPQPNRVAGYSLLASTEFKTRAGFFDAAVESRNSHPILPDGTKLEARETNYFGVGYDPFKTNAVDLRFGGSLVTGARSNPDHAQGILPCRARFKPRV